MVFLLGENEESLLLLDAAIAALIDARLLELILEERKVILPTSSGLGFHKQSCNDGFNAIY